MVNLVSHYKISEEKVEEAKAKVQRLLDACFIMEVNPETLQKENNGKMSSIY
jgi:hypothetical protein